MHGWLTGEEEKYLTRLSCGLKSAIEIGSLFGKSTFAIINGLSKDFDTMLCIDPFYYVDKSKPYPPIVLFDELFKRNLHRKVTVLKSTTRDAVPFILQWNYDFAFVDGDHRAMPTLFDIMICAMRTEKIAVHDYHSSSHREVNDGVDTFKRLSGWAESENHGSITVLTGKKILEPIYEDSKIVP